MALSITPGNQNLLKSFAEYPADSVVMVNSLPQNNFVVSYASPMILERLNKNLAEVIDTDIAWHLPDEEAATLKRHMCDCIKYNTSVNFKYVSTITGKNACIATQIFPIFRKQSEAKQLICIFKDITGLDCSQENGINSKLLMQRVYDFFPEGILVSDDKGFIIECNTSTQELFGISREKSSTITVHEKFGDIEVYKPDYTVLLPEDFPSTIALDQKTVVKNVVLGLRKKKEEMKWMNISSAYLNLPGYGVVTSYTDITQQKKEEEQANALKKTLDAILNCSSDCIIFLDTELRIVLCNQQAHRFAVSFLGRDVLVGEYLIDLFICGRKEAAKEYLNRVQNHEEVITEEKIRLINGEEKWYYAKFYPTYSERGEYIGCVLNYADITERKENELRLQRQHEQLKMKEAAIRKVQNQFETLINSSSDFILLLDANMNVVLYNEEVKQTAIRFLGKQDYDVLSINDLPEENQNNIKKCVREVIHTRKPVFLESKLTLTKNETRLLYSKYFPVFDEAGGYSGCTLIVTDITHIKQKELQIQEQNKRLKELLDLQEKQKEEIRETKNILQAAINSSSDIIAFFDTSHNKVFCNITSEQFAMKFWNRVIKVGDNLFDFLPKKLHIPVRRCLEETSNNHVLNIEKMFRLPNTSYAWYSIRFFPTTDEKGNYIGSFINVCDITERKNAELRLRRQNEELRLKSAVIKETKSQLESLINSSSDYIILIDKDMKVILYNTTANEASLNYLGQPYAKGVSMLDFLPLENRENTIQHIQRVKAMRQAVSVETRFILSEDSKRWLYAKFFPVYNEAGSYNGCAVIATDITSIKDKELQIEKQNEMLKELIEIREKQNVRLKASELEIRETKNQLEAVINSSSDNILFISNSNQVIFYNKAAATHFLKLSNKILKQGENILEYIPLERHEIFKQNLEKLKTKKTLELEHEVIYPDGDKVWFYRKYYPIYNEKSAHIGYVLNSANINKRKLFELKLSKQNDQLREIARIQSHELRRPLANILGLIYLLTEEEITHIERSDFLGKLKISAQELDDVIRKITNKTISSVV